MCKVLMVPGIKKKHQAKVREIAAKFVEPFARTDDDGFGYAAITKKGHIYGEKWLNKEDVFKVHKNTAVAGIQEFDKAKEFFGAAAGRVDDSRPNPDVYHSFGVRSPENLNDTVAMIFHARSKTQGEKTITNTHPFYEIGGEDNPDTAIIHNGSITNHTSLTKKYSTCDSEVILHEYLKNQMYYNPWAIETLAKTLVGEYAVGALTSIQYEDGEITPVLDIFKSNKFLYGAYVKDIETFVFCTSDYIMKDVFKELKLTYYGLTEIKDGFYFRINAITGERMEDLISFELSNKYYTHQYSSNYANQSYNRPTQNPPVRVIEKTNNSTVIEAAKAAFKRKHSDLFDRPYFDIPDGLSAEERAYYEELEKDPNTDMKALHLVKKVLNL